MGAQPRRRHRRGAAVSLSAARRLSGDSVRGSLPRSGAGAAGGRARCLGDGFFRSARGDLTPTARPRRADCHARVHHPRGIERGRRRVSTASTTVLALSARAREAFRSPALGAELGPRQATSCGAAQKPWEIPLESCSHTRRISTHDQADRPDRFGRELASSLQPQQAEVRAVFAPLARLQRDLAIGRQPTPCWSPGESRGRRGADAPIQLPLEIWASSERGRGAPP